MGFKTIFIANLSEVARPLASLMDRKRRHYEIFEDHALCDRFVFSGGDDWIIVTPFPIDADFFTDSLKLMGFKNVVNLFPKKVGESTCEAIISDRSLFKVIVDIIRENPNIDIISYASTPEFLDMISYLKKKELKFRTPETPLANLWTTSFFDSKSGFRQTAQTLNNHFPTMPEGAICSTPAETAGFADYLFRRGRDVVIKANYGLAGAGLKIIRRSSIKGKNAVKFVTDLVNKHPFWSRETVVVEEFIEPDTSVCGGAPNVELRLFNGNVAVLYVCGMRVSSSGVFRGVEMGQGAVPPSLAKLMTESSRRFGRLLQEYGYHGFFEIDFVYSKEGKPYAIEANLRRTGGTHVYELGHRLLGAQFLKEHYLAANNMTGTEKFRRKRYVSVKESLGDLLFPIKGEKKGIILTITSLLSRGDLGYVALGKSRDEVLALERKFLRRI